MAIAPARLPTLLVALSAATFLVTSSGTALAPFLLDIARDAKTDFAAIANLFSLQAVVWGAAALIVGTRSERIGRRRVLAATVALMGLSRLLFAWSESYSALVVWQTVCGIAGGAFMGSVFAAVADYVPIEMRGRALGWVITGQSLALAAGVPMVTWLGALAGWRGALTTHAVLTVIAAVAVWLAVPVQGALVTKSAGAAGIGKALGQPRLLLLLGAGSAERMCYGVIAIYLATFFQRSYNVSLAQLGLVLALVAAGNVLGNFFGARWADRHRKRARTFAVSLVATALLALPLMVWLPALVISLLLGFAYAFANAAGRPALLAALSEVPIELRSAVFGLNIAMASIGWLLAAAVGGWLIAHAGFTSLGVFCAGIALIGAGLALAHDRLAGKPLSAPG